MRWVLVVALVGVPSLWACDHTGDGADAGPAFTAIIPPLPPLPDMPVTPSASTSPSPSASARVTDGGTCGAAGLPDCPLQGWMKQNMNAPMKAHDWQGMADALERAVFIAPPAYATSGYTNWVSIAKDGANAARAAELDAVKAACRGCHQQYKTKYRAEMRTRILPVVDAGS
jgi:hypothetical protein